MNVTNHTKILKRLTQQLGFDYCGIARAMPLDEDARRLETWLKKGMQGTMQYMENHFDLRIDPCKLVPGSRSVITLLLNYFPSEKQSEKVPKIAKYAYGEDYHTVIKSKLKILLAEIKQQIGDVNGRGFVDSAPVLERSWAQRSGLGWIGKNGNLINRQIGSFFFIATLIVDLELEYEDPFAGDFCGSCRICLDACPTGAILDNKVVDGSKCISYFTIELKDQLLPDAMKGQFENWMFGCDTCQDVCPWNRFSVLNREPAFEPHPDLLQMSKSDWQDISEDVFQKVFKNSAVKRTKFTGLKRNIDFLGNS